MTKARDLANIISGGFDATDIPNLDTAKITSGTFVDARLPATALNSNVDLTTLSASNLTSGTVATARLGSGTANSSTFLRGDNTFATAGETNTPMFFVSGSNQTISHNSNTKMTISSESFDTDNCFDLGSNNRFTPNKAGKYFFTLSLFSPDTDDIDYWTANVKKNGGSGGGFSGVQRNYNNVCYNGILTANGSGDYFEAFCEQESGSNRTIAVSEFSAFYIGN